MTGLAIERNSEGVASGAAGQYHSLLTLATPNMFIKLDDKDKKYPSSVIRSAVHVLLS